MIEDNKKKEQCTIQNVVESTVWTPSVRFRWLETNEYEFHSDSFKRILQQKWIGDKGEFEWREIEVVLED